jgi:hypothetical protein
MTKYDNTAQSFVDALNMKFMPQLGYVLVQKDEGFFWKSACTSYPVNEETRKNTGLYRWATVSDDKKLIQVAAAPEASYGFPHGAVSASKVGGNDLTAGETAPIDPNKWAFDHGLEST